MDGGSTYQDQLRAAVYDARQRTFYLVEPLLGSHENWHFIRSQLLKIFGRDGLEKIFIGAEQIHGADKHEHNRTRR